MLFFQEICWASTVVILSLILWTPLTVLLMSSLSLMDQSMHGDSDCALIPVLKVRFVKLKYTLRK